uniref:Reverse transcriptase-like protein n=1 Tax=Philodina roseola TaxID=96448 RepID=G3KGX1_PHIRO|nr:reverse transcriptase-like protein [Philodina roseola]
MSSAAFSETLQFVTNVKLQELEKRRLAFGQHASKVLAEAQKHDHDLIQKVMILVEGIRSWPGLKISDGNLNLNNIQRWLLQATRDPSFPQARLQDWVEKLTNRINHEITQYDYAKLFGNLLTDWLTSSPYSAETANISVTENIETTSSNQEDFEKLSLTDTIEQKSQFESIIFREKDIDVSKLETYLEDLFSGEDAQEALTTLRIRLATFGENLRRSTITEHDMQWCIKCLLAADLLSDAKQATLKEFAENPTVIKELASVLNMQLSSLQTWHWPEEGVAAEPRKALNGKIRFYLDSEILTSLLLQYIGTKWSLEFKAALVQLRNSRAWKTTPPHLTKKELSRFTVFLNDRNAHQSIEQRRRTFQKSHYFMCQLPDSVDSFNDYDDVDENDYRTVAANNRRHRQWSNGYERTGLRFDTPVELKQSLLHIICTDVLLNRTLHDQCTVVRTDLEWFGPSLAHQSILTILKFFGVSQSDLQFIESFLACPLKFTGSMKSYTADPSTYKSTPTDTPRIRKRGTPVAHSLSVFCGEAVLFVMDYAVNQITNGIFLYRIHDDFWFLDSQSVRCAEAWKAMNHFATLTGLKFNESKTGSIHVGNKGELHPDLPKGEIRWGLLKMDTAAAGKFIIDLAMVDVHVAEMRRQLSATTSIFAWTQVYNKYMGFFIRNFGIPAKVYGRSHIDNVIDALARIHKTLFPDKNGNVVETLASFIKEKFNVTDIPAGWYVWPTAAGGLQLKDFFVELLATREDLPENPELILELARKEEREDYENAKRLWEDGTNYNEALAQQHNVEIFTTDPFFSFDEFTKCREERSSRWLSAFDTLLTRPSPVNLESTPDLVAALSMIGNDIEAFGSTMANGWNGLDSYWKWLINLHHEEMAKKYGSLLVVKPTSIPVGMVAVFRNTRTRWEQ